ncbi:Ubiquitin C-terminal hydrolases superfamily protein [Raphanus sativus]|uniref:Uncharacterized protein LOC108823671 n=1 Tax=Raphanus sativus TaxID=3726 RepID=A0A9W3CGA8_RAPSA|nr:uncharacterized protein LOC108823671 [Raphanus sativus]KAJ4875354.1 Ubiquitin C-terminal hydrolases superfamily protein [Raphanus sativus]
MKSGREVKNGGVEEERAAKRKRVINGAAKVEEEKRIGEAQGELDDDDVDASSKVLRGKHSSRHVEVGRDCPYLDTVNRQVLDFDFERCCSATMLNLNVYACLVCGKYFQGRSRKSPAYTHSLESGHHVYINLVTEKAYCLPDGYEINDPCLDDIRHVLNPRFSRAQVEEFDRNKEWSRALDGSHYLPGMVGLNDVQKSTEFVNVTIQSLMRVTPLRNFFLIPDNYQHCKSPLVHRFGELTRKIWHARNFKGHVSPHEFVQAVMKGKKRFRIGQQSDPVEFMSWLLNTLHVDLRTSKDASSIIHQCFQGELEEVREYQEGIEKKEISRMPFLMLGLDLPPPPLFKDVMEKNIIPQVALFDLLKKFDGETVTEERLARMRYRVTKSPPYLMFHMVRFKKNNFFKEKNPTLVSFPMKDMDLRDCIPSLPTTKYNLIANIVHDSKPEDGYFRVFVQRKSQELWYEMQDLHVAETLPQMVELSEAYMQIYELQEE